MRTNRRTMCDYDENESYDDDDHYDEYGSCDDDDHCDEYDCATMIIVITTTIPTAYRTATTYVAMIMIVAILITTIIDVIATMHTATAASMITLSTELRML